MPRVSLHPITPPALHLPQFSPAYINPYTLPSHPSGLRYPIHYSLMYNDQGRERRELRSHNRQRRPARRALSKVARSASPPTLVFVGLQQVYGGLGWAGLGWLGWAGLVGGGGGGGSLTKPLLSAPCNAHVCHAACTLSDVQFRSFRTD